MIINIRGTHGSGKSHLVRQLLGLYNATPESTDAKGRPVNYMALLPNSKALYVVGSYVNACGGCDAIQPYAEIWPRVVRLAEIGHVVFEGALVSSSYGNIGRASEAYGDTFVFAFLDTPLEICIKRIEARRKARGNDKPLDPKNTKGKFDGIQKSIPKIREFGRRVIILDHRRALAQVIELLYERVHNA